MFRPQRISRVDSLDGLPLGRHSRAGGNPVTHGRLLWLPGLRSAVRAEPVEAWTRFALRQAQDERRLHKQAMPALTKASLPQFPQLGLTFRLEEISTG